MALRKKEADVVEQVVRQFGPVIDLQAAPGVLIEIILQFGHIFDNGDNGGGGVSPSTIAVGVSAGTGTGGTGTGGTGTGGTGSGGTGTGGTGGGVSTIAVGVTPPTSEGSEVELADVMRAILRLQRDVNAMSQTLAKLAE
jgi:hypothetical protein